MYVSVVAASVKQLAVQVPALRRARLLVPRAERPQLPDGAPSPIDILKRSAPLALGAAVYQINVMVDGLMAEGMLDDGGPNLHYLANRVQQFPLALVAIAATSAVFPALQALGHKRELSSVRSLHDRTHVAIAAVALPAACGLFALAQPVIEVLFERRNFTAEGVTRMTPALQVLCLAILPAGATGLIARTYYAMGDFLTPVKVSVTMLVLNVGLNAWFLVGLGLDIEGLAAATAITSALNAVALLPGLTGKLGLPRCQEPVFGTLVKTMIASILAAVAAAMTESLLDDVVGRTLALCAAIFVGGATYLLAGMLIGIEVVMTIAKKFLRRRSPS